MAFHGGDCVSRRLCAGGDQDGTYERPLSARSFRESTDLEARFNAKLQELERKLEQTTYDAMRKVSEMQQQLYVKIKSEIAEDHKGLAPGKNVDIALIEAKLMTEVDSKIKALRSTWTQPQPLGPQSNVALPTECSTPSVDQHMVVQRLATLEKLVEEQKVTIEATKQAVIEEEEGLESLGNLAASELELLESVDEQTVSMSKQITPMRQKSKSRIEDELSALHEQHHSVKEIHGDKINKLESAHIDLHEKVLKIHELKESQDELHERVKRIHDLPAKNRERIQDLHDKVFQMRTAIQKISIGQLSQGYQVIQDLEEKVDIHSEGLEAEAKKVDGEDFHFELEVSYDRNFERCIWDALYFFALPSVSWVHSFFIAFGLVCTISCQFIFCYAIVKGGGTNSAFLSDQYPSSDDIQSWRIHSGHNIEYMDTLSGETLVKRLCDADGAVPMSQTFQQMFSDLSQYLSDDIGFHLCHAALILWALIIVKFLNPVMSGILCVFFMDHHHTTTIGKATSQRYNHRITHITPVRAGFIIVSKLLEGAVVAVVGITGAMWLANTRNLQNLILNASALNLVFTVHDLTYCIFLPKKIQRLIETSQPLKLPERSFGGVLHTIVNLLLVELFALPFTYVTVWGDKDMLKEKVNTLCGGNLEFVYTRHSPTNTIYASSTFHESKVPIYTDHVNAITALINSAPDQPLSSDAIAITPDHGKVTLVDGQSLQMYVKAYTSYQSTCDDTSGKDYHSRVIRERTQTGPDSTCADWKAWCDDSSYGLLRLICPITCGCADPLSGQAYRVESEGCPTKSCKATSTYIAAMSNQECQDMKQADLVNYEPWKRYFNTILAYPWNHASGIQAIVDEMHRSGCAGIPVIQSVAGGFDFCSATIQATIRPGLASLRSFCPVTCKCHLQSPWHSDDCPRACYNSTNTVHHELYRLGFHSHSSR